MCIAIASILFKQKGNILYSWMQGGWQEANWVYFHDYCHQPSDKNKNYYAVENYPPLFINQQVFIERLTLTYFRGIIMEDNRDNIS